MTKNIVVISGSPRKGGNSDVLCDSFIKGAQEAGNTVEKVTVSEKTIGFCQGCYKCSTIGACFQSDDMGEILEKLVASDVIVLATPVYFYSMDGQMKTLIDRTLPRYTDIANKDFYFIATAAAGQGLMERTIDGLRGFTDCLPGAKVKQVIYGSGAWKIGDIENTPAVRQAYETGKNL